MGSALLCLALGTHDTQIAIRREAISCGRERSALDVVVDLPGRRGHPQEVRKQRRLLASKILDVALGTPVLFQGF